MQRALDSIYNQSYINYEIIIVDDYSNKCLSFKQKNIIYIRNSKNIGPGASRNIGLKKAKGSYICFLDSDDYWHPDFLKTCVSMMQTTKKEVSFVYVNTIHVEGDKEIGLARKRIINEKKILPTLLEMGRPWDTGACLWNKKIIDQNDSWIATRNWEDYAFDISAGLINNNVIAIKKPLFYCEMVGENKLSKQKVSIIHTEKSKAIDYISNKLKNSIYYKDPYIKNRLALLIINNTIALLDLKKPQMDFIKKNILNLKTWKSYCFVGLIKITTYIDIRIGLPFLRRIRNNMQKK